MPCSRYVGGSPSVPPPTSRFALTLGTCARRLMIPLRLVGVSSNVSRVSMVAGAADVTSTIGDAPETVTDSSRAPT